MHPLPGVEGRVALVTGAAGRGVGRAVAEGLARAGAKVILTDIHERRLEATKGEIAAAFPDSTVIGLPLDAGDRSQIEAVLERVRHEVGPIRVLVNNAAVNIARRLVGCSRDDWDRTLEVNLTGPWYLSQLAMGHMRDAGGGVIVNVSSYAPDIGQEGPYAVTKGGLNALTRVCAFEGAAHAIRAVTVSTGYIADSKWAMDHKEQLEVAGVKAPLGTYPKSAEIAEAVLFLASDRAAHITGETLNIASGAYMRN